MLEHADHAALEHAKKPLNRIRGDIAACIFLGRMVDRLVASELLSMPL
jgi:hypothetical protein